MVGLARIIVYTVCTFEVIVYFLLFSGKTDKTAYLSLFYRRNITRSAYDVVVASCWGRCDVLTSDGRRHDVIKAPNAHWEYYANLSCQNYMYSIIIIIIIIKLKKKKKKTQKKKKGEEKKKKKKKDGCKGRRRP